MGIYAISGVAPDVAASAYVADTAVVIGNVTIAPDCSVWFGAVIRGDNDAIRIDSGANVQEGAVLHTDPGFPLHVASGVTVGHQAMLHGCTIGPNSLVGIQAVVLNGAKIGANCLVGAGALITERKEFPDNSLIVGTPARVLRTLTDDEVASLRRDAAAYVERGHDFASGLHKIS